MKRGRFFFSSHKHFIHLSLGLILILLIQAGGFSSVYGKPGKKRNPGEILREIHKEVKELGFYENETFLRREFHMNLDGNDTNKEEYVMVLSQEIEDRERMVVQVTYFEPQKNNRFIKHAIETKEIKCDLVGENVEIRTCDYEEKKVRSVLSEILNGIRNKKKLLELVRKSG